MLVIALNSVNCLRSGMKDLLDIALNWVNFLRSGIKEEENVVPIMASFVLFIFSLDGWGLSLR